MSPPVTKPVPVPAPAPAPDLAELAAVAAFAPHLAQAFASLACDLA